MLTFLLEYPKAQEKGIYTDTIVDLNSFSIDLVGVPSQMNSESEPDGHLDFS